MTLLDPVSAIVAGAIAGPVLVLLYFLKLRRRRVLISSTLLWQQAVQDLQVNEPFRWLRRSLLMLLQLLALAMLVIALGQPMLRGAPSPSGRVVLMIDRSASMNALDGLGGESRLDEALDAARAYLDALPRGTSVQLIGFAFQPQIMTPATTDRGAIRRALGRIKPTDQPGRLDRALQLVETLLGGQTPESETPKPARVVLLSDGGFRDDAELSLAGGQLEFIRTGPEASPSYDNIGITTVSLSQDYNDPRILRLFLRLQNSMDRDVGITVTLEQEGAVIARKAVRVPPMVDGVPGSTSLTFPIDPANEGLITAGFDRPDLLETDNRVFVLIAPARLPRVLLVMPGDAIDGRTDWVIRDFLEEMDIESLRVVGVDVFHRFIEGDELDSFDLVVLDRVDVPAGLTKPTLSFAAKLPGLEIRHPAAPGSQDRFAAWDRTDPVMRGLVLDSVKIARPAWFEPTDDQSTASDLATGRFGPIVVRQDDRLLQRIGVSFEPAASTWPLDISYTLFLAQAIETLTFQPRESNGMFTTDEPAMLVVEPGSTEIELEGPIAIHAETVPGQDDGLGVVNLGLVPRAGVYRDQAGNPALAINFSDADESSIRTRDTLRIAGGTVMSSDRTEGQRAIWSWFVLGALVLLTLEWVWFARRMRA
ncbi:MAG TPA: VWA domain-containing protein [Phycisphaerales bacterium]|nr:VWA domain-containing protein [Phycisphaerales bacterium]